MDSGILLVPKLEPHSDGVVNSALGGSLSKVTIVAKEVDVGEVAYRGRMGCGGNKQKHKSGRDGELILVMEPQNPSPTKYFDKDGRPLKKELVENELLKALPGGKSLSKKRSKLTITCHKCSKLFETKIEFEFHYRKSYNQEPVYCCTTCDKQINQYKAYRLHIYRHLNSATQRYTCGTCAKVFHQKSDLNRHESVHESQSAVKASVPRTEPDRIAPAVAATANGKIACDRCEAVFANQAEIRIHVKKVHPIPKQMIECPDCGKFLSAGSLYSHRKIHSDGPKFTCEDCDKSFVQKINFIHHRKKHLPNDERPFPCAECGKAFFEKSHLQRHQFFHSEERPYKCDLCGKCYKTERCLKVHSAVHNADRPFVCTECNKGFLSSSKLRQHSNIHSGLRPFKCKYCSRDFTNFPNWLKHIRRRHKVDHRTGEKLDSVPKFMTKKKDKVDKKEAAVAKKEVLQPPKQTPQLSIKEESLPFVGENSNIDLNLVSKDDLLQPLKMEEMEDIFMELPGGGISAIVVEDEDAQHAVERPIVATTASSVSTSEPPTEEDESEPLGPTESDFVDPPPLGLSEDDSELFQFGYVQPEFDCDFSIKNEFSLRREAVNVIREIDSTSIGDAFVGSASTSSVALPAATGALVYDINAELPIFPTLISICGDEQFRLINPNFIHLPQLRRNSGSSGSNSVASGNGGPSGSGLKVELP
ncbi:zinc finger protein 35-like [Aedes albopictus]|uniref:C2H2-type domain-containing protein n=1 Tax=Aedes albopictus TaxID=7160 RepID=A0ABM2A5P2_AEDAL